MLSLSVLFVFLNVPYRLFDAFHEDFARNGIDAAASILFGVVSAVPVLLAMVSIRKDNTAELGKEARMPAASSSLYFVAAWVALTAVTLDGSFSQALHASFRKGVEE